MSIRESQITGTLQKCFSLENQAADTADHLQYFWEAPNAVKITRLALIPSGAVTDADTNYYELYVYNGSTAIVTKIPLGPAATGTPLVAGTAAEFTLSTTAAELLVADGDVLHFMWDVTGDGIATPEMALVMEYENTNIT